MGCCYGVGLIPAFAAIVTGLIARQQIRSSRGLQSGEGLAIAGIVLGAILIVFVVVAICAIMGLGLLGGEIESIFDEITRELESA
jgi:Flp pilus assembly pilin Flp